jgi:hypothetical protein
MATEPGDRDGEQWLDGLAGRPGEGAAHAQGQRLRQAIAPAQDGASAPPWREIERRAAGLADTVPGAAANDPLWRRWQGWAAAALLASAVMVVMRSVEPDAVERGGSGSAPTWVVDEPRRAAEALAGELRALGAAVTVDAVGDGLVLRIRAAAPAAEAVNRRLQALETALDADGTLSLQVRGR